MDELPDFKTELGQEIYDLMAAMQDKHGIEKTALALFLASVTTLEDMHGSDYMTHVFRNLLIKLRAKRQTMQ